MTTTPAWIGLGSNLGDRRATLGAAVAALAAAPGVIVRAVSSYHETSPVGGPPGQGSFLNAAARLDTTLGPRELLKVTQEVEDAAGRVRAVRWGERTLDVDLLIFGCKFLDTPELKLPHPRMAFRRFVLAPLAEIAPTIVDTVSKRTIAELLANLDRRPRFLGLDGPTGPTKGAVFRRLVEELPALPIRESVADRQDPDGVRGSDFFPKMVEALRDGHRAAQIVSASWLVADYCLDRERRYLTRLAGEHAPVPNLVVVLPDARDPRCPGSREVPSLWPESDDPEAIVAEVLATCRDIEGA